jgi:hypothetical protein
MKGKAEKTGLRSDDDVEMTMAMRKAEKAMTSAEFVLPGRIEFSKPVWMSERLMKIF